jgi:hypothetical protein
MPWADSSRSAFQRKGHTLAGKIRYWLRNRRSALEAEASATATRLAQIAGSGRKIWFYDGSEVGDLLKRRLSSTLSQPRVYPLSGPFHDRILEYHGTGF